MNKEVVLIGANSFVARTVSPLLDRENLKITGKTSSEVDITDFSQVDNLVRSFYGESVVLFAAYTNVDGAQKNKALVESINIDGVRNVAESVYRQKKHLIFISSDFVFPGTKNDPGPYREDARTARIGAKNIGEYARSKILGEKIVEKSGCKAAIVRISNPFGNLKEPKDSLGKMILTVKNGYSLYSNQQITPTYIFDLASVLNIIFNEENEGIYHVATYPVTTPYEFGKYAIDRMNLGLTVKEGELKNLADVSEKSPRPIKGGLLVDETQNKLGVRFHSWRDAVSKTIYSSG